MSGGSGKYRVEARLGGGGMAEVFTAATVGAEGFTRKVAIKKVLPGFSDNPQFSQMFVAEAQISSRLQHPNIVSVMDFDRDHEGRLFLVMEMVDGKDLDGLMSTGLLPFPVVIYVITEALRGLGYAHDLPQGNDVRGVVHRDVSPHNVLLSWEGAVKVSDFGIAKAKAASEATASVFIKGKPAYMSPEQANGQPLDGRSDLFAVGVMLWEMLVGRRLFTAEDTRATLAAVLFGQITRPRMIRADIPKDLERVTMKLLERELPARYGTADEAIRDLLECSDAPRNGRDSLRHVLAERYPHQMPMRQSAMSGRPLPAGATPQGTMPPSHSSPYASTGGPQSIPSVSVSAAMSAQTATMMPGAGKRKTTKIILIVAVTIVSAIVTFAIVSAMKTKAAVVVAADASAAPSGPVADAAGAKPPPPTIDAVVVDAPPPVDAPAAPPDAPPKKGGGHPAPQPPPPQPPPPTPATKKTGILKVSGFPVVQVYVDGNLRGETVPPLTITLPVGRHSIRLASRPDADEHYDRTQDVEIQENQVSKVGR